MFQRGGFDHRALGGEPDRHGDAGAGGNHAAAAGSGDCGITKCESDVGGGVGHPDGDASGFVAGGYENGFRAVEWASCRRVGRWGKNRVPIKFTIDTQDMSGEAGKLNINALLLGDKAVARATLQNLFAGWEVNLSTSSSLIDALIDWVDPDEFTSGSNSATEANVRNGPLEKVSELEDVIGWAEMAKEAKEGSKGVNALSKFTVFGLGKLSLRTADQDVIEAVVGLAPGSAQNFMLARPGPDQVNQTQDDVVNLGLLGPNSEAWADRVTSEEEDLWRVTSTGQVGEATRKVVALISRKSNPPQVRARWSEEEAP